jgi:hypothetical protein
LVQLDALAEADTTPFERVLQRYGVEEAAAQVAETRRARCALRDALTHPRVRSA